MKRHNNLFERIVSIENLQLAATKAKKGKLWQNTVKNFEQNEVSNLLKLQQDLKDGTFNTSSYKIKKIYEPKERDIYVLPFYPDRIVQHAIMNVLEPIWDNLFIHNSYACRKGKGQHKGSIKCAEYVRRNKYCLKCDIRKFYPSINHNILFDIIKRKIKCKRTLQLLQDIIYSIEGGTNVPIGNYTSQWFGNLYLNELDTYIKHTLKIKYYARYSDDFILFSNSKQELLQSELSIEKFITTKLKLNFSKSSVFPVTQGVDYLGYRHFKDYILLRKSTAKRVKRRMLRLPKMLANELITKEQYVSSIQSTNGWLKWASTNNLNISLKIKELLEAV